MLYENIEVAIRELKEIYRKGGNITLHELDSAIAIMEHAESKIDNLESEVEELKNEADYLRETCVYEY